MYADLGIENDILKLSKEVEKEAKIAFVDEGNIYIETLNKSVLNDIQL